MKSPTIPRPQSLSQRRAEWQLATALFVGTSEALTLLWSARRLALAPSDGTDWAASCRHLLEVAARSLASPLTLAVEPAAAISLPGADAGRPACPASAPLADHARLAERVRELMRSADGPPDAAAAAIVLSEQIGDLQLQLARHKTRLREILGAFDRTPAASAYDAAFARGTQSLRAG